MANYPSSDPTNDSLHTAVNNLSTALDGAIDDVVTTLTVLDTTGFPTVGAVTIEAERISYTGKTGTTFTGCTRGFGGTNNVPHIDTTPVKQTYGAEYHEDIKGEVIAIATDLIDGIEADLDDGVAPATTAASNKIRLDHIATAHKNATGEADWKDTPAKTIADNATDIGTNATGIGTNVTNIGTNASAITVLENLLSYRRPVLKFVSVSTVDVEENTGTAHVTKIVFPDGDTRTVTEDTSSTHKYRRFDMTATAEFTSGTEDSGLYSGISEAGDTWYAIYAVKSSIDSSKFVLVGDYKFPINADFSTLDSRYGGNGWIYLGLIRNGDGGVVSSNDIIDFAQAGNQTILSYYLGSNIPNGVRLAVTGGAASLQWAYSAGIGNQLANHITHCYFCVQDSGASSGSGVFITQSFGSTSALIADSGKATSHTVQYSVWGIASKGIEIRSGAGSSSKYIHYGGWIDGALGIGPNPLV